MTAPRPISCCSLCFSPLAFSCGLHGPDIEGILGSGSVTGPSCLLRYQHLSASDGPGMELTHAFFPLADHRASYRL